MAAAVLGASLPQACDLLDQLTDAHMVEPVDAGRGPLNRYQRRLEEGPVRSRLIQDATQSLLRRRGLLPRWRHEIDEVFQALQPAIDQALYPADAPRRVVVLLYGQGIAIQRDKLWARLRGIGRRVPLRLESATASEPFLRALFASGSPGRLFSSFGLDPAEAWIVEAGETLHALCEQPTARVTGLSHARLRTYREALARSLYKKVLEGVSGPQELAAYVRGLDLAPPEGALLRSDPVMRAFVRDALESDNTEYLEKT
jgi:hypothetical protein